MKYKKEIGRLFKSYDSQPISNESNECLDVDECVQSTTVDKYKLKPSRHSILFQNAKVGQIDEDFL